MTTGYRAGGQNLRGTSVYLGAEVSFGTGLHILAESFRKGEVRGHAFGFVGSPDQDDPALCRRTLGTLRQQPRLADPGLSRNQHCAATAPQDSFVEHGL